VVSRVSGNDSFAMQFSLNLRLGVNCFSTNGAKNNAVNGPAGILVDQSHPDAHQLLPSLAMVGNARFARCSHALVAATVHIIVGHG
jgi:hypothetical protein